MQVITSFVSRLLLSVCLVASSLGTAHAEAASAKGSATVAYKGKISTEVKQQALTQAKLNALDRYMADSNAAKTKNYDAIKGQIAGALDTYILGTTLLSEEGGDQKDGSYTVVIRADINANRLENALQGSSNMANASSADKSLLTFVFVARQQKSVQSFDDKVYKRQDVEVKESATLDAKRKTSEAERIHANKIETSDSINASVDAAGTSSIAVTTGGSTTKKADVVEWNVTNASEINSVMTGIFSNGGYEVVEAEYLEQESKGLLSIAAIRKDYSTGDDIASVTLRNTVSGVKTAEVPFIALGTLDVGLSDTDPVTGNSRVYVTVTGKVLNVMGRFPKTVSSVGPVQFAGLGPNNSVARTNALKLAAESAAQQMLDELNAKGVQ